MVVLQRVNCEGHAMFTVSFEVGMFSTMEVTCVCIYTHINNGLLWLLEFFVSATSKVISGRALTCDSTNSW